MRCCYSLDFGAEGCWKEADGSFRARLSEAIRERHGDNVDEERMNNNLGWINPRYGGAGWQPLADVAPVAEAAVWTALEALTGITRGEDGVLRYAPGADVGGKKPRDPTKGRALRRDSAIARSLILQASPAFFFPKIREEEWSQDDINYRPYAERGALDMSAVARFQTAAIAWAQAEWGDRLVACSLHLDEMSPHVHIVVIPARDGKLCSTKMIAGPAKAKALIDGMAKFFQPLGLARPTEGGKSTGATYEHFRRLKERVRELLLEVQALTATIATLRKQKEVAEEEALASMRKRLVESAVASSLQTATKAAKDAERKRKDTEADALALEAYCREAAETLRRERERISALLAVDVDDAMAALDIVDGMASDMTERLLALTPAERERLWQCGAVQDAIRSLHDSPTPR